MLGAVGKQCNPKDREEPNQERGPKPLREPGWGQESSQESTSGNCKKGPEGQPRRASAVLKDGRRDGIEASSEIANGRVSTKEAVRRMVAGGHATQAQ